MNRARFRKGMGIAAFLHGAGFTGSGERYLGSVVGVEGCADGKVRVLVSSTEFGQGTKTVLCQIAAEALGLPYEHVEIAQADTNEVPNSGPTVASRTVMVVGKLVQSAALGIKQTLMASGLLGDSYSAEEFRAACRSQVATRGPFKSWARYEAPADVFWDDEKYRGEAYAAFAWAVYIAEVTVDLTTYSVSVDDFVALQEVGKVLHPVLARGQIAGGVAQGIGYYAVRKSGLAKWPHAKRPDDELHHAHFRRPPSHPGVLRGAGQHSRGIWRERNRRACRWMVRLRRSSMPSKTRSKFLSIRFRCFRKIFSKCSCARSRTAHPPAECDDRASLIGESRDQCEVSFTVTASRRPCALIPWRDCWTYCGTSWD